MDQFDQRVAEHHLARRDRHILADRIGQRREFTAIGFGAALLQLLQVMVEVLHAVHQVLAKGLLGLFQHFGVGRGPVRGRQRVHALTREELHHVAMVARHAIHFGGLVPPLLTRHVAVFQDVEGPHIPAWVGEAAVLFGCGAGRTRGCAWGGGLQRVLHRMLGQFQLALRRSGQMQGPVGIGQSQRNRRHAAAQTGQLAVHQRIQRFDVGGGDFGKGRRRIHGSPGRARENTLDVLIVL